MARARGGVGDSPARGPRRRVLAAALVLLCALGAWLLDIAVGRWVIGDDGIYKGRILPPYGAVQGMTAERLDELIAGLERAPSEHVFRAFDPELGWTNRPGERDGFSFSSVGARGRRELGAAAPAGTTRIVCYGDSFTYGSEVGDEDTWAARLEAIEPRLEAVNMGVAAYGTDQAFLRFRRRGLLGADVVVVGLLLENVCRNVNRYRSLYEPMETTPAVKPRFVLGPDRALELVPVPFADERSFLAAVRDGSILERTEQYEYWAGDCPLVACSATFQVIAARRAVARRRSSRLWRDPAGEPFRVTVAILDEWHREARAAGARAFVVLVFGTRLDMAWLDEHGSGYWGALLAELDQRGVPWIDTTEALRPRWREEGVYLEHHLGATGNAIVAGQLAEWLAGMGI